MTAETDTTPANDGTPASDATPATEAGDVVVPALLRAARGTYGNAIRARLAAAGFEDLPRNGPHVLGGMVNHGVPAAQLLRELGVSKQARSQLIDTLVVRGYVQRGDDPQDRRRLVLAATERGRAAAAEVRAAVLAIDEQLAQLISPAQLEGMRAGLLALCEIRERSEAQAHEAQARTDQANPPATHAA
ncbi:MAG TPA: MarR family transcriptional regulator [Solirubrobacteraceae bacterium]|nr:MarR family transcriptional regulator [Solirubrobacteraceae bacterium]